MKHAPARKLRHKQTDCERTLWYALRDRRFLGHKFRRQQPIGPYVADFVCFEAKLIIELDGSQHSELASIEHDRVRTAFLEDQGFRVLRFWNSDFVTNSQSVMEAIYCALEAATPHPRRSGR